jgi:hypothetical protein
MPQFKFSFLDKQGKPVPDVLRSAYFDTGCNVNLMSSRALKRDAHMLGPEAQILKVKPFNINMADGKSRTVTFTAVQRAKLVIRRGWYHASFLVVDDLAADYLIGMPFILQYNVQIKPQEGRFILGLPQKNMIDQNQRTSPSAYQVAELHIATKKLTLVAAEA